MMEGMFGSERRKYTVDLMKAQLEQSLRAPGISTMYSVDK